MIRLKDTRHTSTADFLSSAIRIAEYYGFEPLSEMRAQTLPAKAKSDQEPSYARREERVLASAAKRCVACAGKTGEKPMLLAWRITPGTGAIPATTFELHVLGTSSAVAEALLVLVAHAITEEAGLGERSLAINSIGSYESSNRYIRDIGGYLRKHIESISPTLRPKAALDPLGTLVQLIEKGHPAVPRAPQSMEYLTEEERRKFWELLEYLEACGLSYELSPLVLGSRDFWAHSLYEIAMHDAETGTRFVLAQGGRYDPLATRLLGKQLPAAMISISCETRGRTNPKRDVRGLPAIYFAHLGAEARRKSLTVLEDLRRAEIPVHQSLLFDKIGDQMARARDLAVPYILILGYKETMEGTILVREVATNSQEAIPTAELPNYLRRRRMGTWKPLSANL